MSHKARPMLRAFRVCVGMYEVTVGELADLLRQAEAAHAEYERTLGHRDDDWPAWYAKYILNALEGGDAAGT
jgi:hypothetical protein